LAAVLLLALRLVVEVGFVAAELLVLPRLDAEAAFFLETRLFPLRGFSLPVTVSTNAVTALDAISFAAAMFILAASVNASGTDLMSPSFSLSIVTSLLCLISGVEALTVVTLRMFHFDLGASASVRLSRHGGGRGTRNVY
jgi:hypothetical protein